MLTVDVHAIRPGSIHPHVTHRDIARDSLTGSGRRHEKQVLRRESFDSDIFDRRVAETVAIIPCISTAAVEVTTKLVRKGPSRLEVRENPFDVDAARFFDHRVHAVKPPGLHPSHVQSTDVGIVTEQQSLAALD